MTTVLNLTYLLLQLAAKEFWAFNKFLLSFNMTTTTTTTTASTTNPKEEEMMVVIQNEDNIEEDKQKENNRGILVLDLDETLVHSSYIEPKQYDFARVITFDGVIAPVYVSKRPGVDEFLKECRRLQFEIVIFTASVPEYANPVIDELDKENQLISRRFFKNHCIQIEENGHRIKDLSVITKKSLRLAMIDNNPQGCCKCHSQNVVPIKTWISDPNDRALTNLLPWLEEMSRSETTFLPIINMMQGINTMQGEAATTAIYKLCLQQPIVRMPLLHDIANVVTPIPSTTTPITTSMVLRPRKKRTKEGIKKDIRNNKK